MPPTDLTQPATPRRRRGLDQKLLENNTAILADTLHFETLSMHDFFYRSVITPASVFDALNTRQIDYFVWAAAEVVMNSECGEEPGMNNKALFISRIVNQLFFELAKAIGDRLGSTGPYVVQISYEEANDNMSSIVETAQRMRRTFTKHGVPRNSVIISIPATEAGILAARVLQNEGMITCLHSVTSLVHAQACIEAEASAISISVGPLLALYERRRNTVYQSLNDHPGIEAIQSILAYFKVNGIKTRVLGADFRSVAEIGLLSECDAVCVSAEHLDKLRWSQVPTASLDLSEKPQVVLRARQAKYPTDLLTREGGFSTWFSPASRSLASTLLHDALRSMRGRMKIIEHVVEEELSHRFTLRSSLNRHLNRQPTPRQSEIDNLSDVNHPESLSDARSSEEIFDSDEVF